MKHATVESWADYIRGIGTSEHRREMIQHLAVCHRCSRVVGMLYEIAAVVQEDAGAAAPSAPAVDALGPTLALLGDGQRSNGSLDRAEQWVSKDLCVEANGARVHVRVAMRPLSGLVVIGQVSDALSGLPLSARVSLHGGGTGRTLAQGRTPPSGEFVLECAAFGGVLLRIAPEAGREAIDIPLDEDPLSPQS